MTFLESLSQCCLMKHSIALSTCNTKCFGSLFVLKGIVDCWRAKLEQRPLDRQLDLCQRPCCRRYNCFNLVDEAGGIPLVILEGERARFVKQACGSQVTRKWCIIENFLDPMSHSGFSLYHGHFPIFWRGLIYLLGVSTTLLQTVAQTTKARYKCTTAPLHAILCFFRCVK